MWAFVIGASSVEFGTEYAAERALGYLKSDEIYGFVHRAVSLQSIQDQVATLDEDDQRGRVSMSFKSQETKVDNNKKGAPLVESVNAFSRPSQLHAPEQILVGLPTGSASPPAIPNYVNLKRMPFDADLTKVSRVNTLFTLPDSVDLLDLPYNSAESSLSSEMS